MDSPLRPIVPVSLVLLVVLAGCSLPVIHGGQSGNGTPAVTPTPTSSPTTDTAAETEEPSAERSERPTASEPATPTTTPEPTPTVVSETGIRVVEINADVEDVTDEYIVLKNTADAPLDMSGWRVKDQDGHVFTFPDGYTLGIDETVTLHSGRGTQSQSDRYWWEDSQVWDANGETIAVFDDRGHKIYERSYS